MDKKSVTGNRTATGGSYSGDIVGSPMRIASDCEINYPYDSLRDYLLQLRAAGELQDINAGIGAEGEYAALTRWIGAIQGPAILMNNVEGTQQDTSVIGALWGSYARCALAFGCRDYHEALDKVESIINDSSKYIEPVIVDTGPCKENIIKGNDINLRKVIPFFKMQELERSAYFTLDNTVTKDPYTGIRNAGVYWHGMADYNPLTGEPYPDDEIRTVLNSYIVPGVNHGGIHYTKLQQKNPGAPMEVAIVAGLDPVLEYVGGYVSKFGVDEYAVAGGLRGRPVKLVKCETVDLEVPASAEFVVEGLVQPGYPEEFRYDGPPSSFHGYVPRSPEKVMKTVVTCITHRNKPIWPTSVELWSPPVWDHLPLAAFNSDIKMREIKTILGEHIQDVAVLPWPFGEHNGIVVISINFKPMPHFARQVMHAVWALNQRVKWVIVVDDDIDVRNWGEITMALSACVQPARDIYIEAHSNTHFRDASIAGFPSEPQLPQVKGEAIGIDATVKVPEYFSREADPRPRKAQPSAGKLRAVYEKLKSELDFSGVDVEAYLKAHAYKTRYLGD
ncbi:MAG: UbiD family decarboxylase domain-containing protein [Gammaproteobacteria bacterium]